MPDLFDSFCSLWPGANPGGWDEGYMYGISSSAIFKNAFDKTQFFMISNLFDNNKLDARIMENVRTKCIIFGEKLKIKVKKFKQNLPENYSKST